MFECGNSYAWMLDVHYGVMAWQKKRKFYTKLAGVAWDCPGHYIKVIKCIMKGKAAK
jgi:hypothetical protein